MSFVTSALGIQNGYNTTSGGGPQASAQQQAFNTNLTNVLGQQGDLATQLLAQSQGAGPNIANLQLQQATNQNNQQAAGAIASQRGMNPALAQRLISQQQAMNNQNAAGQAGVLRAQQQLAAQQGLANVYGQQAGENLTGLGQLIGAQTAANESNAQTARGNSQQAGAVLGGALGALGSVFAEGGEVKALEPLSIPIGNKVYPIHLAAGGKINPLSIFGAGMLPPQTSGSFASPTPAGAVLQPSSASADYSVGSGLVTGLGKGLGDLFGGSSTPTPSAQDTISAQNAEMGAGGGMYGSIADQNASMMGGPSQMAEGGKVPAMISPGERYIPPKYVDAVRKGHKKASEVAPKIPGKAKVKGDSEVNDTVPAFLRTGGVVVPRTKADNNADAREFLQAIQADKEKKQGPSGYARVLAAKRKNA